MFMTFLETGYQGRTVASQAKLYDFPVGGGELLFPAASEMQQLPYYELIGDEEGRIVFLGSGANIDRGNGLPTELRFFGSWGEGRPNTHTVSVRGKGHEFYRKAALGVNTHCLCGYFGGDCGCKPKLANTLHQLSRADASIHIYLDEATPPKDRRAIVGNILDNLGVKEVGWLAPTGFERDCSYNAAVRAGGYRIGRKIVASTGNVFIHSHCVPVMFQGRLAYIHSVEELSPLADGPYVFSQSPLRHGLLEVSGTGEHPMIRYHRACCTSHLNGSLCDCEQQKEKAIGLMLRTGGIFINADIEGMFKHGLLAKGAQTWMTAHGDCDLLVARSRLGLPFDGNDTDLIEITRSILPIPDVIDVATNNVVKLRGFLRAGFDIHQRIAMPVKLGDFPEQACADFAAKENSGQYHQYA